MRILFLGGTSFVGRHIAEAAIAAGHSLTFFTRGVTNSGLFADQAHLHGDRAGDVGVLSSVDADVVIDTSGYTPDEVAASARAVAGRVRKYVFMSSIDAYAPAPAGIDESSPTKTLAGDADTATRSAELYGAHKARCERDLVELLGAERVVSVRAGLMVGPYDNTDRFTYWPVRVARGGEILAPVSRDLTVQLIDVRDVADWTVGAIERDLSGVYSLVGTPGALDLGDVLDACCAAAPGDVRFTWVTSAFLGAHEVAPWSELPLWLPLEPAEQGLFNVENARALATGLRLRPLEETARDTLAEYRARPSTQTLRSGLAAEREAELLAAWHATRA